MGNREERGGESEKERKYQVAEGTGEGENGEYGKEGRMGVRPRPPVRQRDFSSVCS